MGQSIACFDCISSRDLVTLLWICFLQSLSKHDNNLRFEFAFSINQPFCYQIWRLKFHKKFLLKESNLREDKAKYQWPITLNKKMKFSIMDFFSICDQICRKLPIWSHILKKSLMENFILCAV